MSGFPALPVPIETPFTNPPSRQQTPFGLHLPEVLDIPTLQEEVRKHPEYVFDSILQIVEELDAAQSENEALKCKNESLNQENEALHEENFNLKESWMDLQHQTIDYRKQLTTTQRKLATTQRELEKKRDDLDSALEEHNQRRLDWNNRVHGYEELLAIGSAKQVILWKFIERIQKGTVSDGESDLENKVPPMTGTKKALVPAVCDTQKSEKSQRSSSIVTEHVGSPEKAFNPTAVSATVKEIPESANKWNRARLFLEQLVQQRVLLQRLALLICLELISYPAFSLSHLGSMASVPTHSVHPPHTSVRCQLAVYSMSVRRTMTRRAMVAMIQHAAYFMNIVLVMKRLMGGDVVLRVFTPIVSRSGLT